MEVMEIVEYGPLTVGRRAELEGDEEDPFDAAGKPLQFRPKDRHVGLRGDDGRVVAQAGMVIAEAEVEAVRFDVVGLGGVIVNQAYRGRGYAREVVEAAVSRARGFGPSFMLLFCFEDRAGLYRKLGFTEITDEVRVEQPGGYARMDQRAMWRALRPGAAWPPGAVTLHSLPF
jgi:GNAT superfamily N-acetyltransferase